MSLSCMLRPRGRSTDSATSPMLRLTKACVSFAKRRHCCSLELPSDKSLIIKAYHAPHQPVQGKGSCSGNLRRTSSTICLVAS